MPYLEDRSVRIHYEVHGNGHPVVLLHEGTASFKHNYANCGWIEPLNDIGLQVIGLDFRGHGKSAKPHDAESYGTANLASDVLAVLDQLALPRASLVAYSIGTAVALHLMQVAPEQFDRAALVATGEGLIGNPQYTFARILPALAVILDRTEYPRDLQSISRRTGILSLKPLVTNRPYGHLHRQATRRYQRPKLPQSRSQHLSLAARTIWSLVAAHV